MPSSFGRTIAKGATYALARAGNKKRTLVHDAGRLRLQFLSEHRRSHAIVVATSKRGLSEFVRTSDLFPGQLAFSIKFSWRGIRAPIARVCNPRVVAAFAHQSKR